MGQCRELSGRWKREERGIDEENGGRVFLSVGSYSAVGGWEGLAEGTVSGMSVVQKFMAFRSGRFRNEDRKRGSEEENGLVQRRIDK